jgi:TonB family protein
MKTIRGKVGAFKLSSVPVIRGRGFFLCLGIFLAPILIGTPWASPADAQTAKERKVITRVAPEYPETLKHLRIGGVVRIRAVVAPNGTVESTRLLGGNPILGQAAMKAVKQWKYSNAESQEELEVKVEFYPYLD